MKIGKLQRERERERDSGKSKSSLMEARINYTSRINQLSPYFELKLTRSIPLGERWRLIMIEWLAALCDVSACGIFHRGNVRGTLRLIFAVTLRGCTCGPRPARASVQFSFQSFEDRAVNDDTLDIFPRSGLYFVYFAEWLTVKKQTVLQKVPLIQSVITK